MTNTEHPTPSQLLRRFVAQEDIRQHLMAPWRDGDFVYASNGHWIARIPVESYEEVAPTRCEHPKAAPKTFSDAADRTNFAPLGPIDAPPTCRNCNGTGKERTVECPDCDGIGMFMHGLHDYDCKRCEATGSLKDDSDTATESACVACDGYGLVWDQFAPPVELRGSWFNPVYLTLLNRIPGLEIAVPPQPDPETYLAARFRAGELEGLLMPCRPPRASTPATANAAAA